MNRSLNPIPRQLGVLCLLCVALILSAPAAMADQDAAERAEQALRDFTVAGDNAPPAYAHTAADGAAVRARLDNVLARYEWLCRTMKMSNELEKLRESRAYLQALSDEHLSALAPALPELSQWSAAATALTGQVEADMERTGLHRPDAATDTLPVLDYWEPNFPCVAGPLSTLAMVIALEAMQLADAVWAVLEHVCGVTIAGFNVEYVCIFVGAPAYSVAKAVYENLKFCADDQVEAHVTSTYDRTGHLHEDIELAQAGIDSTRISVDSMMTIMQKLLEDQARDLRMQIEINLSGHGVHPHAIAMFQLPASHGGYLDTARTIVVETIDMMRSLGDNVQQAESRLAMGDEDYLNGHFKDAYYRYSQAYRYATRAHSCATAVNSDTELVGN